MSQRLSAAVQLVEFTPQGGYDLRQSAEFGFGQRDASPFSGTMSLAFCLDDYKHQVGVAVRQRPSGTLECAVSGRPPDLAAVVAQVARVLSVDVDGRGWDSLGQTDRLIGRLQAARQGLRPPLFYSAYEAALWVVLSARRPHAQMAALREQLSRAHGQVFDVAGTSTAAVPTPAQLLDVSEFPGLPAIKLERMQAVARAALAGRLDTAGLRATDPEHAGMRLRSLAGVGPFYAELIVVRALGHTDVLPTHEPRVLGLAGRLTGLNRDLTAAEFARLAEQWRPWRTWASVAIRAAGEIVLAGSGAGAAGHGVAS